jgi:hypothetical protein
LNIDKILEAVFFLDNFKGQDEVEKIHLTPTLSCPGEGE